MTITAQSPVPSTESREDRPPKRARPMLSRRWRRFILLIHILASVGWFGITATLFVLTTTALGLQDTTRLRAAYEFHETLISTIVRPAAITTVISGLVLSLGTQWGLLKHYWPPAKLILTIATIALTISNSPAWIAYVIAHADAPGETVVTVQYKLVGMSVFHIVVLSLAAWLSVYKPRGRIRRRRTQR